MSAAVPAPDPNAEMQQFHASIGADGAAAPAEQPADTSPTPVATWRDEVIDDEDLPQSLRGLKVNDYIAQTKRVLADTNAAGYAKNQALARAEVAEATARLFQERLAQQQQNYQAQTQRAPQPHEIFGMQNPQDIYAEGVLPRVVNQLPQVIDERVNAALAEVRTNEIEPMRRSYVAQQMETAQERVRTSAQLDPQTWLSIRPKLASILHSNDMNPGIPEAWAYALDVYRSDAAKLFPQQVSVSPGSPPAGNARPGVSAPAGARKRVTSGSNHVDAEVKRHVEIWKKQGIDVSAEEIMSQMASERSFGGGE